MPQHNGEISSGCFSLGGIATVGALGLAAATAKGNDARDDAQGKQQ